MSDEKTMGQVIQIDEARIRDHLGEMVRGTVEETLNAMLDAEADRLCAAGRYERSQARQDTRAGSYERTLHTKAGDVSLKIPKLRRQTFETAIIQRYRRRPGGTGVSRASIRTFTLVILFFSEQVPNQNCQLPCGRDSSYLLAAALLDAGEKCS